MEDLYADSIRLVEMLLLMEEKGIHIPFEDAWNIKTVGDAYQHYIQHGISNAETNFPPAVGNESVGNDFLKAP